MWHGVYMYFYVCDRYSLRLYGRHIKLLKHVKVGINLFQHATKARKHNAQKTTFNRVDRTKQRLRKNKLYRYTDAEWFPLKLRLPESYNFKSHIDYSLEFRTPSVIVSRSLSSRGLLLI